MTIYSNDHFTLISQFETSSDFSINSRLEWVSEWTAQNYTRCCCPPTPYLISGTDIVRYRIKNCLSLNGAPVTEWMAAAACWLSGGYGTTPVLTVRRLSMCEPHLSRMATCLNRERERVWFYSFQSSSTLVQHHRVMIWCVDGDVEQRKSCCQLRERQYYIITWSSTNDNKLLYRLRWGWMEDNNTVLVIKTGWVLQIWSLGLLSSHTEETFRMPFFRTSYKERG